MCPARLELLPPGVLDISLSKLTYDELARTSCVSKTVKKLVVSALARRFDLGDHLADLGTGWLRQMDLGARNTRVAMCDYNGLIVDFLARASALGSNEKDSAAKFPKTINLVNLGRRSALEVRCSRSASAEWRWVV